MYLQRHPSFNILTEVNWAVKNGKHCDTYKVLPEEYIKKLAGFVNVCVDNK